jgi:hypothetical protein
MHMARFAFVLAIHACGGSNGTPPTPDAPSGPPCTGAVYDSCATPDQCSSQNCHLYNNNALQVCTQACSGTVPCPNDSTGAVVACNMMGSCKPAVANNCHR